VHAILARFSIRLFDTILSLRSGLEPLEIVCAGKVI